MEVLIGKQVGLLRSMASGRVISLIVGVSVFATVISCASEIVPTVGDAELNSTPVTEVTVSAEFNADSFAAINPQPEIRELDLEIDLGFYERERLPRDAIEPIYTPKFVSPEESVLRPTEMVMGLEINGDARAYPTGMLRAREMVNDEVGGTPVLVSW